MALHDVLAEKLNVAVRPAAFAATRRDATLPDIRNKAQSIIGMRRAGKTTFLRQLQADWRTRLPPERAVYLSFDDDRLMELPLAQLDALLETYYRRFPDLRNREMVYWLLDEIHLVDGWERFVRRILDTETVTVVVSGSSARLLSHDVHTALRGRSMETVIRPFSFREYLRHRGEVIPAADTMTSAERSKAEKHLLEYLEEGGLPEAQGLPRRLRIELLQGYVDTLLFRDVVERHRISQTAALRWLTRHCLRNPASTLSLHAFHRDLKSQGLGVTKDLVYEMVGHLVDAFLISTVPLATDSDARLRANPRKVYPVDAAMIRAFDVSGRSHVGRALETCVFHELQRRRLEVGYVKTADGAEVDFRTRDERGREELVQVCADLSDPITAAREFTALAAAAREHPRAAATVIVLTRDQVPRAAPEGVRIRSAVEWLLGA